jgi:hypothetical protein
VVGASLSELPSELGSPVLAVEESSVGESVVVEGSVVGVVLVPGAVLDVETAVVAVPEVGSAVVEAVPDELDVVGFGVEEAGATELTGPVVGKDWVVVAPLVTGPGGQSDCAVPHAAPSAVIDVTANQPPTRATTLVERSALASDFHKMSKLMSFALSPETFPIER